LGRARPCGTTKGRTLTGTAAQFKERRAGTYQARHLRLAEINLEPGLIQPHMARKPLLQVEEECECSAPWGGVDFFNGDKNHPCMTVALESWECHGQHRSSQGVECMNDESNIFPRRVVRDTLAHAIHQWGAAPVVPHTKMPLGVLGGQWKARTMLINEESEIVYIIDASIVNTRRPPSAGVVTSGLWKQPYGRARQESGPFRLLGRYKTTAATKFLCLSLCFLLGDLVLTRESP
jgi:hypothetical protein